MITLILVIVALCLGVYIFGDDLIADVGDLDIDD